VVPIEMTTELRNSLMRI